MNAYHVHRIWYIFLYDLRPRSPWRPAEGKQRTISGWPFRLHISGTQQQRCKICLKSNVAISKCHSGLSCTYVVVISSRAHVLLGANFWTGLRSQSFCAVATIYGTTQRENYAATCTLHIHGRQGALTRRLGWIFCPHGWWVGPT